MILMIQNIEILVASLLLTTALSFGLLFLPAIIELKKPKDAGPRLISDSFANMHLDVFRESLINIEDTLEADIQGANKIHDFYSFIQNLEI
jgi:hypothetical protein